MREIEFMLGRFAERHVVDLDDDQLDRLESLIEESDADLFGWISAKSIRWTAFRRSRPPTTTTSCA